MQIKIINKRKEDQLIELNLIIISSFITESEQYTNLSFEFEGIELSNKYKIRVAIKHDENVNREDDAAYYLFPNLKNGDFIKILLSLSHGNKTTSFYTNINLIED